MGGTAPGLPGPEALEVEWSSSSSEESPVYATKPVFILFAVDSETGRGGSKPKKKKERIGSTFGNVGEKDGERKNTQKKQQQQHVLNKTVQVNYIQTHFGRNK